MNGTPHQDLAAAQWEAAARLVIMMESQGARDLDRSAASLARLDAAVERLWPAGASDAEVRRVAPLLGAYIGEVLIAALGGGWVADAGGGAPLVEDAGRYRARVADRAERLLREGPGSGRGAAALLSRTRRLLAADDTAPETVAAAPALTPGRRGRNPLGNDRPLGLRRGSFYDTDARDPEPILEVIPFRAVAQDAPGRARDSGFGPSLVVWILILAGVAVVAWAAYLYRNAPP